MRPRRVVDLAEHAQHLLLRPTRRPARRWRAGRAALDGAHHLLRRIGLGGVVDRDRPAARRRQSGRGGADAPAAAGDQHDSIQLPPPAPGHDYDTTRLEQSAGPARARFVPIPTDKETNMGSFVDLQAADGFRFPGLRGAAGRPAQGRRGGAAGNLRRQPAHPLGGRRLRGRGLPGGRARHLPPGQAGRRAGLRGRPTWRPARRSRPRPRRCRRPGVLQDIQAAIRHAAQAGKVGVVGYCWGGLLSWRSACALEGLSRRRDLLRRRHDHARRSRAPAQGAGAGALRRAGPLDPAATASRPSARRIRRSRCMSTRPTTASTATSAAPGTSRRAKLARERSLAFFGKHLAA